MYAVFPQGYFPAVLAGLFLMDHAPSPPKIHAHLQLNLFDLKKDN